MGSSGLNSGGGKVRSSRVVRGSPALNEFAGRMAGADEGSLGTARSNGAGDGFAPLSQGLGRKLPRLPFSMGLAVIDLATVNEFPRLASYPGRSTGGSRRGGGRGRGYAFPFSPSDTWEIGNVEMLTGPAALYNGWEIGGTRFKLLRSKSFE